MLLSYLDYPTDIQQASNWCPAILVSLFNYLSIYIFMYLLYVTSQLLAKLCQTCQTSRLNMYKACLYLTG